MKLILVGFMGSGKTTVGKEVAKRLKITFVDLDQEIEKATGKRIREIFKEEGEEAFRKVEREVLIKNLQRKEDLVVSTGGGTPIWKNNLEVMKKHGTVIYLKAPFSTLWKRIEKDENRPLAQSGRENAEKLFKERLNFYEKADLIINTEGKSPPQIAEEIVHLLKKSEKIR